MRRFRLPHTQTKRLASCKRRQPFLGKGLHAGKVNRSPLQRTMSQKTLHLNNVMRCVVKSHRRGMPQAVKGVPLTKRLLRERPQPLQHSVVPQRHTLSRMKKLLAPAADSPSTVLASNIKHRPQPRSANRNTPRDSALRRLHSDQRLATVKPFKLAPCHFTPSQPAQAEPNSQSIPSLRQRVPRIFPATLNPSLKPGQSAHR